MASDEERQDPPKCGQDGYWIDGPLNRQTMDTTDNLSDEFDDSQVCRVYRPAVRSYWLYLLLIGMVGFFAFFPLVSWRLIMSSIELDALPHWINGAELIRMTQLFGVGCLSLLLVRLLLDYYGRALIIDRQGVTLRRGLISRDMIYIRFHEIRTIGLRQGLIDRLLNMGILEFASSGTDAVDIRFIDIAEPLGVKAQIESLIERQRLHSLHSRHFQQYHQSRQSNQSPVDQSTHD